MSSFVPRVPKVSISMGLIPRSLLRSIDRFEPIPRCLRRGSSFVPGVQYVQAVQIVFAQGTRGHLLFSVQTSGGGGTIERPVALSTMEPSAGQYIRHIVQPG